MLLPSGEEGLLVELKDGSLAVMVAGPGGQAMVVKETSTGKRTQISLSSLKDFEGATNLAAGKGRGEAVNGTGVMNQVNAEHDVIACYGGGVNPRFLGLFT